MKDKKTNIEITSSDDKTLSINRKVFRCLDCNFIPLLSLSKNNTYVIIDCLKKHHSEISLNEYMEKGFNNSLDRVKCSKCGIIHEPKKIFKICKECNSILCKQCSKEHISNVENKDNHHIISIRKMDINCFLHNLKYNYFCKKCNENICDACLDNEHKEHDIIKFDNIGIKNEEIEKIKDNIKIERDNINELIKIFNEKISSLQNKFMELIQNRKKLNKFKSNIIGTLEIKGVNYQILHNINELKFEEKINIDNNLNELDYIQKIFSFLNGTQSENNINIKNDKNKENEQDVHKIKLNQNDLDNFIKEDSKNSKDYNLSINQEDKITEKEKVIDSKDDINENENNENINSDINESKSEDNVIKNLDELDHSPKTNSIIKESKDEGNENENKENINEIKKNKEEKEEKEEEKKEEKVEEKKEEKIEEKKEENQKEIQEEKKEENQNEINPEKNKEENKMENREENEAGNKEKYKEKVIDKDNSLANYIEKNSEIEEEIKKEESENKNEEEKDDEKDIQEKKEDSKEKNNNLNINTKENNNNDNNNNNEMNGNNNQEKDIKKIDEDNLIINDGIIPKNNSDCVPEDYLDNNEKVIQSYEDIPYYNKLFNSFQPSSYSKKIIGLSQGKVVENENYKNNLNEEALKLKEMLKPKEEENNKNEINDKDIPDNKNEIDKNINIINIDNENILNELYNISEEDKIDKDDIPAYVPCSNSIFVDENNNDSKNEIDENNKNNYINESDREEGQYLLEPVCSVIKENESDEMSNSENTNIIKEKANIKDNKHENQIKEDNNNKDGISKVSDEDEKIKDSEEEKNKNEQSNNKENIHDNIKIIEIKDNCNNAIEKSEEENILEKKLNEHNSDIENKIDKDDNGYRNYNEDKAYKKEEKEKKEDKEKNNFNIIKNRSNSEINKSIGSIEKRIDNNIDVYKAENKEDKEEIDFLEKKQNNKNYEDILDKKGKESEEKEELNQNEKNKESKINSEIIKNGNDIIIQNINDQQPVNEKENNEQNYNIINGDKFFIGNIDIEDLIKDESKELELSEKYNEDKNCSNKLNLIDENLTRSLPIGSGSLLKHRLLKNGKNNATKFNNDKCSNTTRSINKKVKLNVELENDQRKPIKKMKKRLNIFVENDSKNLFDRGTKSCDAKVMKEKIEIQNELIPKQHKKYSIVKKKKLNNPEREKPNIDGIKIYRSAYPLMINKKKKKMNIVAIPFDEFSKYESSQEIIKKQKMKGKEKEKEKEKANKKAKEKEKNSLESKKPIIPLRNIPNKRLKNLKQSNIKKNNTNIKRDITPDNTLLYNDKIRKRISVPNNKDITNYQNINNLINDKNIDFNDYKKKSQSVKKKKNYSTVLINPNMFPPSNDINYVFGSKAKITSFTLENKINYLLEIAPFILGAGNFEGNILLFNIQLKLEIQNIKEHSGKITSLFLLKDKNILSTSDDGQMKKIKLTNNFNSYIVDFVFVCGETPILKGIELSLSQKIISISWKDKLSIWTKSFKTGEKYVNSDNIFKNETILDIMELPRNELLITFENDLGFFDCNNFNCNNSIKNIKISNKQNSICKISEEFLAIIYNNIIQLININNYSFNGVISMDKENISSMIKLKNGALLIVEENETEEFCIINMKQYIFQKDEFTFVSSKKDQYYNYDNKLKKKITHLVEFNNGIIAESLSGEYDGKDFGEIILY